MVISIIAAISENNVIGKDNKLIWHLPADLNHFKELTTGHHLIMGRKTWESIGSKPLPGRTSIVITRDKKYKASGCTLVHSLDEALEAAKGQEEVFVIGGAEIYKQTMALAHKLYITRVHHKFEGDTFFPEIGKEWFEAINNDFEKDAKNKYDFSLCEYERD
ncbi:MAG TPA: dihydrofolate reductase [Bacteroidia bacterium]|jgi:dihydrofolate reductase|nr:dihydrofolate reductase [Bacteroidia bacterium]